VTVTKRTGTTAPPMLGEGAVSVQPPANDDPAMVEPALLTESPFKSCRKLIAPGATLGAPVELIDPEAAGDSAWWYLRKSSEGHPTFYQGPVEANAKDRVRLLLGDDGILTTVAAGEDGLGLKSFWNKLAGKVSQGFESVESGVADMKKLVNTSINVAELGGRSLYVSYASPAAKLYSAVRNDGPAALQMANGVVKDGAVYAQVGAKALKQGTDYALQGPIYIAEYIQANICMIGMSVALASALAPEEEEEIPLLTALGIAGLAVAEEVGTGFSQQYILDNTSSPLYKQIRQFAKFLSLPTAAVSKRYTAEGWADVLTFIVAEALVVGVEDAEFGAAGMEAMIIGQLSNAICYGMDKALSAAHTIQGVDHVKGISPSCNDGIKNRAVARYEGGEDVCHATTAEIQAAAATGVPSNPVTQAWDDGAEACPNDPNADGYVSLLENMGCQPPRTTVTQTGGVRVDPSTVLDRDWYWGRTNDWHASVACPAGQVAVGMCSSGENQDCYGTAKEILCAGRSDGAITENRDVWDLSKGFDTSSLYCPNDYAVTEFCSSGKNPDCSGTNLVMRCSPLASKFYVDYGNCSVKESKSWTGRLDAASSNSVMVAMCTSGKYPDCGVNKDVTKSAMFCPIYPRAAHPGRHAVTAFQTPADNLLTTNIGENPIGYTFFGAIMYLFDGPATDRTPLYRCLNPAGQHFYSSDANCEGNVNKNEGALGYMHKTTGSPIYRCYTNRHETWPDANRCAGTSSSILGYAP
jgi:hypothetical protein